MSKVWVLGLQSLVPRRSEHSSSLFKSSYFLATFHYKNSQYHNT